MSKDKQQKNLKRLTSFNAKSTFGRADSFAFTSRIWMSPDERVMSATGLPIVTCSAFATELYFKVLANLESGLMPLHTHHLECLYNDLSDRSRTEIREYWERVELPNALHLRSKYPPHLFVPKTFQEALTNAALAFMDFRYETEKSFSWWLRGLWEQTRALILERRPDWRPPENSVFRRLEYKPEEPEIHTHANQYAIDGTGFKAGPPS